MSTAHASAGARFSDLNFPVLRSGIIRLASRASFVLLARRNKKILFITLNTGSGKVVVFVRTVFDDTETRDAVFRSVRHLSCGVRDCAWLVSD